MGLFHLHSQVRMEQSLGFLGFNVTYATGTGDGLLSLCWNNHRATFFHVISSLRQKERYSDVTLACEGKFYPVHKLVLSVCSDYFDSMLERTPCKHPIIVLRDVHPEDLEALLTYMYEGIVNVSHNDLARLIKTAEMLRIKGLAVPDDSIATADGRRLFNPTTTTTTLPIINTSPLTPRQTTERRGSPQPKRRRREENGGGPIVQTFTHGGSSPSDDAPSPSNQDHYDRHQRTRVEIETDPLKDVPQTAENDHGHFVTSPHSQVVVAEAIVKEEQIEDAEHLQKGATTATLISTYGVVVSDGGGHHTLVSHPQDPNPVIAHRYEAAQLPPGCHQAHSQPLAEAVAEALAGPAGMQSWLGGGELVPTGFATVEAYSTEPAEVQTTQTIVQQQPIENNQTSTTVNVTSATGNGVNAVASGTSTPIIIESTSISGSSGGGGGGGGGGANTGTSGRGEGNPLRCQYCNRATFRQTSDLKRHIRIHTGEKPFKCKYCPYKASRKDLLHAHSTKMHNSQ